MQKSRTYIVALLISLFLIQLSSGCFKWVNTSSVSYVLNDIEDNSQEGEDLKSEFKVKEYDLNKTDGFQRMMSLSYSFEHAQYNVFLASGIFLDIITPPPQV